MLGAFKRFLATAFGAPPLRDPYRVRLTTLERGFLFDVFRRSNTIPVGAWQASTEALRAVALRLYDKGRITKQHIEEALT